MNPTEQFNIGIDSQENNSQSNPNINFSTLQSLAHSIDIDNSNIDYISILNDFSESTQEANSEQLDAMGCDGVCKVTKVKVERALTTDRFLGIDKKYIDGNNVFTRAVKPVRLDRILEGGKKFSIEKNGKTKNVEWNGKTYVYEGTQKRVQIFPGNKLGEYQGINLGENNFSNTTSPGNSRGIDFSNNPSQSFTSTSLENIASYENIFSEYKGGKIKDKDDLQIAINEAGYTTKEDRKTLQRVLGFSGSDIDGIIGNKTLVQFMNQILHEPLNLKINSNTENITGIDASQYNTLESERNFSMYKNRKEKAYVERQNINILKPNLYTKFNDKILSRYSFDKIDDDKKADALKVASKLPKSYKPIVFRHAIKNRQFDFKKPILFQNTTYKTACFYDPYRPTKVFNVLNGYGGIGNKLGEGTTPLGTSIIPKDLHNGLKYKGALKVVGIDSGEGKGEIKTSLKGAEQLDGMYNKNSYVDSKHGDKDEENRGILIHGTNGSASAGCSSMKEKNFKYIRKRVQECDGGSMEVFASIT